MQMASYAICLFVYDKEGRLRIVVVSVMCEDVSGVWKNTFKIGTDRSRKMHMLNIKFDLKKIQ